MRYACSLEGMMLMITIVLSAVNLWGRQIKRALLMAYGYSLLVVGFLATVVVIMLGREPFRE